MLVGTTITWLPATPELPGRMFCDISIQSRCISIGQLPGLEKPFSVQSPRTGCSGWPLQRTFQEPQSFIHIETIALSQDAPLQGMAGSGQEGLSKALGTHLGTGAEGPGVRNGEDPCSLLSQLQPAGWLAHCSETALDLIYAN